jgi:site-specific recombinase XerC
MPSPTKNGLFISDVESQYDAYLLKERGLSRSTRNLHHHVVHRFLSSRFQIGYVSWNEVRFNDFAQFLTSEFARLHNRPTQTAWLMILRSLLRYLSHEGHIPPDRDAALPSIATRKHISLPRGLSPEQVRRFGQPVKVGGPATSVTGRYCWLSCVSGSGPRRSPTSHLQTSIESGLAASKSHSFSPGYGLCAVRSVSKHWPANQRSPRSRSRRCASH